MKDIITILLLTACFNLLMAQQSDISSTYIENFGAVWDIPEADFITDRDMTYKVIFDIYDSPDDASQLNPQINTIARFINMHVRAGVPVEHLKVSAVFHNKASKDIQQSDYYQRDYDVPNPNEALLKALHEAGVELFFCGQSSRARDIPKDHVLSQVKVGLSAMTVMLDHAAKNYTVIKF